MGLLNRIGRRQHTTKRQQGYLPIYEQYFGPLRLQPINLLEIGVDDGASMRMWRDYFPTAQIHGVDISDKALQHAGERINIHIGDQVDQDFMMTVAACAAPLSIIIDDGGHQMHQQIRSFEILFPMLAPGGIYVVEDLHTSYIKEWRGDNGPLAIDYFTGLVDDVNRHGHVSHIPRKFQRRNDKPSYYEQHVRSIHFYKSMCIIMKGQS